MKTNRCGRAAVVAFVAMGLTLACQPALAGHGDWRPDAWVTAKSKIALATSDDVSAMAVNVDTTDGNVTLHGTVGSEAAKTQAAKVVESVEGVRTVRNLLQVVPATDQSAVAREDGEVRAAVVAALKETPQLKDSEIEVGSVNSGVVLLEGTAADLEDRVIAIRTVRGVEGVSSVRSEITGPEQMEDYDSDVAQVTREGAAKTKDAVKSAGTAMGKSADRAGQVLSDAWITTKVKTALITTEDAPFASVNVDTTGGEVTLFGSTEGEPQKAKVEEVARSVDGVKSVRNLLQVIPPQDADKVARTDETIEETVETALDERPQFEKADIDVEVVDGVVRLTGTAPSNTIRSSASTVARSMGGVRSVKNDVRVVT